MAAGPNTVVSRLLGRLMLWLAPRNHGTRVPIHAALRSSASRQACFDKVETALGLIAQYDPSRFRRLEADVTAIVVWPAASFAGSLNAATRICL